MVKQAVAINFLTGFTDGIQDVFPWILKKNIIRHRQDRIRLYDSNNTDDLVRVYKESYEYVTNN